MALDGRPTNYNDFRDQLNRDLNPCGPNDGGLIVCKGGHILSDNSIEKWLMNHASPPGHPNGLASPTMQHTLSQVAGLASDASAVALDSQQPPLVALQLLEQGRGLLAASAYEMRMDIMNLQEADPVLAEKFIAVREQLQSPIVSETNIEQTDRPSWKSQSDHRHKADEQFDKLVAEIRGKQGFENFVGAPSLEEMQDAAASGPIAVINVSTYRCDAILVETHQTHVLTLPSLNREEIKEKTVNVHLGSPELLQWLWDVVTEPVLNALGYIDRPSSDQWPHFWWIPTDLLTRFPPHAAGYHDRASGQTVTAHQRFFAP
ncbi:hypothetical protein TSTA_080440 [Talaromyces stipitatus ATCC 10500]|uniref:Uncharacterized protein n=1 Tax=Talaromyces stipitatus (strain ATCC 10500 / CBS 375.48 / QM 6759 / NRRL 1006) TaxID=441959 RepID=B8MVK9_TALSN|nr:uncharacterized protein TSTA_080440 [Talaromyces stipitatus ATCC 10500]EED11433.1 hypothetical protein TSTA_080440 [Talaromyces stipitatus ATCC 10500]